MSPAQAAVPHHNPRRLPLCSRLLLRQNSDSIKATLAMVWEFENQRRSEHLNTRPSQEKLQKHFPPTRRLTRPQRTHNCSGTITGLRHKPEPERQSWLPSWGVFDTALQRKLQTLSRGYSEAPSGCPSHAKKKQEAGADAGKYQIF